MQIQLEQLAQELQKIVSVQSYNIASRVVTGIEMFPVDFDPVSDTLRRDTLYVCDYRKLRFYDPHLDLAPLVCVMEPGAMQYGVFFSNRTVIVTSGLAVTELMAKLVSLIYDFGTRASPLGEYSKSLLACKSVRELMDKGLELLGNPLVLTDETQKILAWADKGNAAPPYSDILALGYLPVGHFWLESDEVDQRADDYPFVNEGREENGVLLPSVLIKRLRLGGKIVGYLHVFQFDREFSPEDRNVAELLGNLLSIEIRNMPANRGRNARTQEIERFLQDILENARDEEYTLQMQRGVRLKLKRFVYTVVVYSRKSELFPCVSYYDLSKRIAELLPDCFGFLFRNSIFLLLSSDEEIPDIAAFFQPAMPILEKYHMIVGVSNPFFSLTKIRQCGFQARKALQLGSVLHEGNTIFCYRDYSIYYMMELCLKSEVLEAFCLPEVAKLVEHSEKDSGDLLNTLKVYLRCGRSKSQTAREMFVHLNTVKYRLGQIQSIMGLDLENDDNALKIMLSFKLQEYSDVFKNYEPLNL